MIVLSTFCGKHNLYLRKERVEIQRLIVCLCRENDFVDTAIGQWISEGDICVRCSCP